jgi:hypothetical protein
MTVERQNFCKSLVRNGVKIILDENTLPDKPSVCLSSTGKVLGYYSILIDYEIDSDSFLIGYKQYVKSSSVYDVFVFDSLKGILKD